MAIFKLSDKIISANSYPWGYSGAKFLQWTPADITTALWLDASDSDNITLDGSNNVEQWDDKSGNDRHAAQATESRRPSYNSISKALEFDGSDDYLSGASIGIHNVSFGIFVVATHDAAASESTYRGLYHFGIGGSPIAVASYPLSTRQNLYLRHGGAPESTDYYTYDIADGEPLHILAVKKIIDTSWDTEKNAVGMDGGDFTSTAMTEALSTDGTYTIGYQTAASSDYWLGSICEFIVVKTDDSDTFEKIEGYLAHKWGLEANLPAGHSYKSFAPIIT